MKRVFPLLASAPLAFGQITTNFDESEEGSLLGIGIIPVEDYQKAVSEIDRLKRELEVALRGQAAAQKAGVAAANQRKLIQNLRDQLKVAHQRQEKEMVAKVDAMEKERRKTTQSFQKQIASLQTDFGRKQGEWEKKLVFVEGQRDGAIRELDELSLIHI